MQLHGFSRAVIRWVVAISVTTVGLCAHAIEISIPLGAATLGRPLELKVPITLDRLDDDPCAQAQLEFGSTKAVVFAQWQLSQDGISGFLNLRSQQAVDEPIVTVHISVGCQQKLHREFVLFPALDAPRPPTASHTSNLQATPLLQTSTNTQKKPEDNPSVAAVNNAQIGHRKPKSKLVQAPKAVMATPKMDIQLGKKPQSRLKLEPLSIDYEPKLRTTLSLSGPVPDGNSKGKGQALALWKAVNSSAEERLQDQGRLQSLNGQVTQLKSQLLAQQEALEKVKSDLDRHQVYANYLLGFLIFAVFIAAYVYYKRLQAARTQLPWWTPPSRDASVSAPDDDEEEIPPVKIKPTVAQQTTHAVPTPHATATKHGTETFASEASDVFDRMPPELDHRHHGDPLDLDFMKTVKVSRPIPLGDTPMELQTPVTAPTVLPSQDKLSLIGGISDDEIPLSSDSKTKDALDLDLSLLSPPEKKDWVYDWSDSQTGDAAPQIIKGGSLGR